MSDGKENVHAQCAEERRNFACYAAAFVMRITPSAWATAAGLLVGGVVVAQVVRQVAGAAMDITAALVG